MSGPILPGTQRRHEQYVMNTITKAWCRFTEWSAEDFAVFNGELYFCAGRPTGDERYYKS